MKVQDYSQMIRHMTRDKTTDVPGSMAHELRMAQGIRQQLVQGGAAGQPAIFENPKFINKVKNLVDKNLSNVKIADKLNSSPSTIQRVVNNLNISRKLGKPTRDMYEVLNKDKNFEKFFKEYLEKESKVEVAGRTRASKLWPVIEEVLKDVPKNASLKEKFNAIKNFNKSSTEYGYKTPIVKGKKYPKKMGDVLYAHLSNSFKDAEKGFGKLTIKQLADNIPAYSYKTLQFFFGEAKKDPEKFTGNAKQNIINAKTFINKLKDLGLKIAQGDFEQKAGGGRSYLFEPLTDNVKKKLKELKPLKTAKLDYDKATFRSLVKTFSQSSEDYKKFGFAKDAIALEKAANNLNLAMIKEFTSKPLGDFKGKPTLDILEKAMSKDDVARLRQFIEDTPQIKNVLSIAFDSSGKNGTYFKPRDLNQLSGSKLLRDILIEKDHIFPVKEISMVEKPTKTKMGRFGPGGALAETPFNKVLTTGYFNNSLRNKIQNFLGSGRIKPEAIKQINNTLKGLDTTIYHNGNYYGGKITPSIEKQINRLGYDKFDIQADVVNNIKEQDSAIKQLKNQKFSDSAIMRAVSKSKFAFPFTLGAGFLGYKGEDILKGTGLMDKEYELTASAGDAPLVEKGLSTGEKVAAGTAAGLGIGTKTGRKILGNTLSAAGLPLSVALNTAIGIDPTSAVDRTILAGEAALAPSMIKDAIRVTNKIKNPLLRKVAQGITTINPKYALKAARALSPIGIASLAGEGLYQVGKLGYEDQKRFNALSPEEQAAERAKQEAFAFDITGA